MLIIISKLIFNFKRTLEKTHKRKIRKKHNVTQVIFPLLKETLSYYNLYITNGQCYGAVTVII